MLLVSVGRFTLGRRYWLASPSSLEASSWAAAFAIGAGLAGAGWGAAAILLYPEGYLANQVLLVFIVGGMMLGAVSHLAPLPEAYLAFIVPSGLAPAVRLAVQGDEAHIAMGLMAGLFTLATLITTRRIHRTIVTSLKLQFECQEAEATVRESEQRLVSIYNTVEDAIFHLAVEPEGQFRFLSVNSAFLRVTGLSEENVAGKTVNEVIPEPSLTMVLGKYRQAIDEHTVVRWEETSDYPAGRLTGEVSVGPVFDNTGTCTHLVGSVHDITQRKRAEEKFSGLLEAAPDGMVVMNEDGKIILVNSQVDDCLDIDERSYWGRRLILMPERFRSRPGYREITSLSPQCGQWDQAGSCTVCARMGRSFRSKLS